MTKQKKNAGDRPKTVLKPCLTPEARENRLISLAIDLVEQRLIDGTASSQEVTHFLKLGSTKERIEREIMESQRDLIVAKTQNLKQLERIEDLYTKAIDAMRDYSGKDQETSDDTNIF